MDGFGDPLLTVVSVYVHVLVIIRVVVVIVVVFFFFFVPTVNVLLEQLSNLVVGGRECIVPIIFLLVLVLSAVLVLQLGNKRVCVDIFV